MNDLLDKDDFKGSETEVPIPEWTAPRFTRLGDLKQVAYRLDPNPCTGHHINGCS